VIDCTIPDSTGVIDPEARDRTREPMLPDGPDLPAECQTLEWFMRPYDFLSRCAAEYGETFTLRFREFGAHVVFSSPAANKEIFSLDARYLSAGKGNVLLGPGNLGPCSMFALDGEGHSRQRRTLGPSCSKSAVDGYEDVIREETLSRARTWPTGQPFPVLDKLQEILLNTIARLIFGAHESSHVAAIKEQVKGLMTVVSSGAVIKEADDAINPFDPRVRFRRIRQEFYRSLQAEIEARGWRTCQRDGDLLSILLAAHSEAQGPVHHQEIADQVLTLLVAGHETTATSVAWALYWLHSTPEVLERLLDEIASSGGSPGPDPSYLDAFCQEVLRICPVVPIVLRVVMQPLRIQGVHLEPGTIISSAIYLTHHREDLYDRPKTFDPGRFLRRRYAPHEFLPFGGGGRRCIGMHLALGQMKVMLVTLLSKYSFQIAARRTVRPVRRSLTIGPSEGLPVLVFARDHGEVCPHTVRARN
jgi:cytochrome P450 family 110